MSLQDKVIIITGANSGVGAAAAKLLASKGAKVVIAARRKDKLDAVADEIKAALIRKEGRCGILYDLVLSYESADWDSINRYAEELGIPNQMITSLYFICVDNVNVLWEQLTKVSPKQEA